MAEHTDHKAADGLARWAPSLALVGLILFHAINNWIWLSKNVMTRGWDRIGALVNSLYYHDTLSHINLETLFKAATQDQIRPPLFGMSMALMYKPFGVSMDVAVMANVVYMAFLVLGSYGIGRKLGSRRLGLLAAVLVTFIPLIFAMSRYSYFEFALTAFAVLSVFFLLATRRFEDRTYSVMLGLSLGLGLLIKRTFPVFVLGAVGVVALQAGIPRKLLALLNPKSWNLPRWRDVGLAVLGGGVLSGLWYLPNRDAAQALSAGVWMLPIWWLSLSTTVYLFLRPSSALTNAFGGASLALSVASLWYLPHSDFIQRALRAGWGVNDPRGREVALISLSTYTDYLESILYGFSPVFWILFLLCLAMLAVYVIRQRKRFLPSPCWDWAWWSIIASLVAAYVILSTSIYKEHRAITPLLPFLGILFAGALLRIPWRRLRIALIALVVTFGLVQYFAISYTEAYPLVQNTTLPQPVLGQWGLFAQGPYLELPDSGVNDPGYYIAGDVLQRVDAARQAEDLDSISLAILAGSSHVHVGMFAYDQLNSYPEIQVENPVQIHPDESGYSMAFRYDYVLVLSEGTRGPAVREASDLIVYKRRGLFEQAFELDAVYPLPNGTEAYLFRRIYPSSGAHDDGMLHSAAEYLHTKATAEDLVVVHPPGMVNQLLEHYSGEAPIEATADLQAAPEALAVALEQHPSVFFVTDQDLTPDAWLEQDDVADASFQEQPFGSLRVIVFEVAKP